MDNTVKTEIKNYIDRRLDDVILDSDKKFHPGLIYLKKWVDYDKGFEELLSLCILNIHRKFHFDDGDNTAGMSKLTATVSSVGQMMITKIDSYPAQTKANWKLSVILGGLIVEALQELEYVVVNKDAPDYVGILGKTPIMIHATYKWNEMVEVIKPTITKKLGSVYPNKPHDINGLFDTIFRKPIIKRFTDEELFDSLLEEDFIAGLNNIRQTGWRINKDVFNVVINTPMDNTIPEIPREGSKREVDLAFKEYVAESRKRDKGKDNHFEESLHKYEQASIKWSRKKEKLKTRSQIVDRQITIARATCFINLEQFFYDVETDYRGRVYYSEAFLNYQGSDLAKSLLEFSEGTTMTVAGYEWLLIHIANCWNKVLNIKELEEITWFECDYISHLKSQNLEDINLDKLSLEDRKRWSLFKLDELVQMGELNVVEETAEKPFMLLAACIELSKYMTAVENGVEHITFLPIPVDGTANGIQHTAAITRDRVSGSLVGLTDLEFPIDLYVKVGQRMMENYPEFFESRNMPIKDVRKIISKRATMTRQYSAGRKKISESMFSDAYKLKATEKYNMTAEDCDKLATVAIEAIDNVCPSNSIVRDFLQELVMFELGKFGYVNDDKTSAQDKANSLKRILKSVDRSTDEGEQKFNETLEELRSIPYEKVWGNGSNRITWITPSGFPVFCNLFDKERVEVQIRISGKRFTIVGQWDNEERPDISKHVSSIAANMIHSLDSTHMVNTAKTWGNSFGAVHDSFATHASNVDGLIETLKDEFLNIYDGKDMFQYFIDTIISNKDGLEIDKPKLGDLDLKELHDSNNFFA